MEELELSEEEIEIEVEEEVEVEIDEEEEKSDVTKKEEGKEDQKDKEKEKKEPRPSIKKERKSIIIKKKVSGDIRKDILLRASLSDNSTSKYIGVVDKSHNNINEFKLDNIKNSSKIIHEDIIDENINENKIEVNDNNNKINNNINILKKTSEEEEYIEKIINLMKTNEIEILLESKKWEEKKNGFIKLNDFIEKNSDIFSNLDTFIIYIKYKLNNFKESNFNILKEGIRCFCSIFNKINRNDKPNIKYLEIILNGLNEKISEPKLKDIYIELLVSLMNSYTEKIVIDELLSLLDKCKKIVVLKEYVEYIDKIIEDKLFIVELNIKGIIDFLVNTSNNSNPQLRNMSSKVICHLYKYIGPDLKLLIKNIKESTLKNIYKEMEKIEIDNSRYSQNNNNKTTNKINNEKNKEINFNVNSLIKPIDISKLITSKLLKEIDKGKWQEKKDGIDYITKVIEDANKSILPDGLKNLFDLITEKLSDSNKNFVRIIIQLLSLLIISLGENIKIYSKLFVKPLLLNLSDKNQNLREDCIECAKNLIKYQNFEIIANFLPQLDNIENSDMRNEILNLLISNIKSLLHDNYSDSFFKELTKLLLNFLQDKSGKIRNKTEEFIIKFKGKLKKKDYLKQIDKFKPSIAENLKNIFDRIFTEEKDNNNNNINNKNNQFKKIDITKKSKTNIIKNSKNSNKELMTNEINENNKTQITSRGNKKRMINSKNNSLRKLVNFEDENENKIMNKTISNWTTRKKNQTKNENNNSFITSTKKIENKNRINKNNTKNEKRPKLSVENEIDSKYNSDIHHERAITEANPKSFKKSKEKNIKLSNEKNVKSERELFQNKIKLNKNVKKIPVSGLKKSTHRITSSLNTSKEEPKKNKNINKNNEKKLNSITKEELISILNILLNDEKEIVSSILNVHNLIYKNFNNNKDILIKNSDIIFQTFIDLIKKLFSYEKTDIKIIKYVTNVLCKISGIKELVNNISLETHINLIKIVFFFVSYEEKNRLEEDDEGIIIWKSFNSIMLHIIDYCNFTENICILIKLININLKEDKIKLSEYGSRCLAIINQTIKDINNTLKISDIFKEIHLFLIDFEIKHPNLQTNNQKEKNIIETIIGLINELVKVKRDKIFEDYNNGIKDSETPDKYIKKWIEDNLNKIKEEEKENELKLIIDEDIDNYISEELLTNI